MTEVRVMTDLGSCQVTVKSGQWSQEEDDEDSVTSDEIRFYSLDESNPEPTRSSWSGCDDVMPTYDVPLHGRQSYPSFGSQRQTSPGRLRVISDVGRRHRSSSGGRRYSGSGLKERPVSNGSIGAVVASSTRRLRLSRDATQPNSGSMSDLHGTARSDEEEESDVILSLGAIPSTRPRAFTCPDIKVIQRRMKLKVLHRPPTPTPGDDPGGDGLAERLESSCSLSNSGEIFVHDEEDELPVIVES